MDRPVELVPLVCPQCSTPVPAEAEEMAWVCAQCAQGLQLDAERGLMPLQVFYSAGLPPNATGKPYWVAEGRVQVQRQTYSGNSEREAGLFWAQPRQFIIPAYELPLETLIETGTRLLQSPPVLEPGPATSFLPVTFPAEDAHSLAEFMVVGIEAGRKDKLKELAFSLELGAPALWILP